MTLGGETFIKSENFETSYECIGDTRYNGQNCISKPLSFF